MPARKTWPRRIRKVPVDKVAIFPEGRSTSLAVKGYAGTTGMRQSARKRAAAKRLSADDALSEGDFQKVLKAFVPDVDNIEPVPEEQEEENTDPKIRRKLKDSQPDENIDVCDDKHNFSTGHFQISNRRAAASKKRGQKVVAEKQVNAEVTETNSDEKQSEDEEEETIRTEDWQKYIKPIETPRSSENARYKPEEPEEENTLPKILRKSKDSQQDEDIEVCDDENNFCTGHFQISNRRAATAKKLGQKVVAEKQVDAEVTETNCEEKQCEDEEEDTIRIEDVQKYIKPIETPRSSENAKYRIQSVEPNYINPLEGKDTEAATLPKTLRTIPHDQASSTPPRGIAVDGTICIENERDAETADVTRTQVQDGMDNGIFAVESLLGCGGDGVGLKKARNQKNKWEMITEEMYQRKQIYNLKTSEIKQKMELRKKKMELFDLKIQKAKLKIENTKKTLELEIEVLELKKKKYAAESV